MKLLKILQSNTRHTNRDLQALSGRARALHTIEWFLNGKSELQPDENSQLFEKEVYGSS